MSAFGGDPPPPGPLLPPPEGWLIDQLEAQVNRRTAEHLAHLFFDEQAARMNEQLAAHEKLMARLQEPIRLDETLTVPASQSVSRKFTLYCKCMVRFDIEGTHHVGKGFSCHLHRHTGAVEVSSVALLESKRSVSTTRCLGWGTYEILVANPKNIINSMVVRLRVTSEP